MTGKLWHIAGLASQSGRSFLKAGVGLYNFATDGNVRSAAIANIQDTWDHLPRYTIRGMQAFSDMSTGQRVDAAIKFGFDSALSFGAGKVIGATGSVAYGGVSRAAQFIENSQLVWRPVDYSIGSLAVKKPLGMFERITTVTPEMSARFQGMGYLDLITNTFNVAPIGETMAVDHIFPSAEIAKLPGFNAVTKSQMTSIIRDSEGFGNLQP